jgi:hypothetical protein
LFRSRQSLKSSPSRFLSFQTPLVFRETGDFLHPNSPVQTSWYAQAGQIRSERPFCYLAQFRERPTKLQVRDTWKAQVYQLIGKAAATSGELHICSGNELRWTLQQHRKVSEKMSTRASPRVPQLPRWAGLP